MSNKVYDVLKYIQRAVLPSVTVLLGAIGKIVNWDCGTIVAIISAIDVFMFSLLEDNYNKWKEGNSEC